MRIGLLSAYFVSLCCFGALIGWLDQTLYDSDVIRWFGYTNALAISSVTVNLLVAWYHNDNHVDKIVIDTTDFDSPYIMISTCFVVPLIEEYLFRHVIRRDLDSIFGEEYVIHIVSILFGLYHLSNYSKFQIPILITQIIHTTILGYILFLTKSHILLLTEGYLLLTNSLMYCALLHMYYNIFVYLLFQMCIIILNLKTTSTPGANSKTYIFNKVYVPKRRHSFQSKTEEYEAVTVTEELCTEHYKHYYSFNKYLVF
jgi:membrane protease YdiL (CAAX protease family)